MGQLSQVSHLSQANQVRQVRLGAAEFCDAIRDPAGCERLSTAGGAAPVVLDVRDADDARLLDLAVLGDGVPLRDCPGAGLATVVVAAVHRPALATAAAFADVVLDPDDAALGRVSATVAANPLAATSCALLLRSAPATPRRATAAAVMAGLVAESATFSALQSGPEFARWRAATPIRPDTTGDRRVSVRRDGGLLEVTLDRPGRHNALDTAMRDALVEALTLAVSTPGVRIRLRGAGPSYSAGGDLDEFGAAGAPATSHVVRLTRSPGWLMHLLAARTEVHLHGACLGSGIELPAFAGHVVAAPDTRIGLPEIGLGLIPGAGGTVSLPHRIGRHRTAYLALSGERIDARTALNWGLVDAVTEPPEEASPEGRHRVGLLTRRGQ